MRDMSSTYANPSPMTGGLVKDASPYPTSRFYPLPKLSSLPISKPSTRPLKPISSLPLPPLSPAISSPSSSTTNPSIGSLPLHLPPLPNSSHNFEQKQTHCVSASPISSAPTSYAAPMDAKNNQFQSSGMPQSPHLVLPPPTEPLASSHDSLIRRLREFTVPQPQRKMSVFTNEENVRKHSKDDITSPLSAPPQKIELQPFQRHNGNSSTLSPPISIHNHTSQPSTALLSSTKPMSPLTPPQISMPPTNIPNENHPYSLKHINSSPQNNICPVTDLGALSRQKALLSNSAQGISYNDNNQNDCNIVTNNDERPFACRKCNATFRRKDNLTAHIKAQHKGERPFRCDLCGFRFIKKDHAMKHWKVVHLKERPFVCNHCDSRFGQRSDLNKHFRSVHLRIKPFECKHCGLRFSHRGNQIRHQAVVHEKKKPFTCTLCSFTFAEKSNLIKHCHAVHKLSSPIVLSNHSTSVPNSSATPTTTPTTNITVNITSNHSRSIQTTNYLTSTYN